MKAVILAAGQGTRLRPLTNHLPKCLVQVHEKPLLQYQLESLEQVGIGHCIIVVGYLGDQVRSCFGTRFGNVHITYVTNDVFEQTNNIYSLWLARQELNDDILLLEGDLLFEDGLLGDLTQGRYTNVAVVDRFNSSMNGTVILASQGLSTSMVLKAQQSADFDYRNALKTVNIYVLSQEVLSRQFLPTLDSYIDRGLTSEFYEAVIAQMIADDNLQMTVHMTGARRWTEIDTEEDLRLAEKFFPVSLPSDYTRPRQAITRSLLSRKTTRTRPVRSRRR
ncbi:MAG: phosphocholine cytidylyltransferase family protein [Dehalococcoidia bacterium]|jgi:NDP-sugar pyrophosphorylase family protein|nr:phosphocholine cytidylyltransferase family protein [Dehalococcoidia bacterium]